MYKLDGDTLTVHTHSRAVGFRETATDRPAGFAPTDDPGTFLYVLERVKPNAADERVKLGGDWFLESLTVDGAPDKGRPAFEAHTFTGGRLARAGGAGESEFALDPARSPKHIDFTEVKPGGGRGPVSPGIYKLDGDTLQWHAGKPGATNRPVDFTPSKPGTGHTLAVFRRARPPEPPVGGAGTGSLSGHVTVGGKSGFGTAGRVTVYHGHGNTRFSGARLVGGTFTIDHVPAGEHQVEIEVETGGGKRTEVRAVTVAAGARQTMTFDLKAQ